MVIVSNEAGLLVDNTVWIKMPFFYTPNSRAYFISLLLKLQ